jgi:dephospho-CoA kinase
MNDRPVPTIGLMGAPGSGKSLVARQMASMGCAVIDSDNLARRALDQPDVIRQVRSLWGDGVIKPGGGVDRKALARIVFADPSELKKLESLTHPIVHAGRASLRADAVARPDTRAIIEDSPLLLESGIDRDCDVLVLVDAPFDIRLDRVRRTRGWDAGELHRREKNQMPLDIKRQRADYVIINDADEAHCLEQTRRVLSQITP